MLSNTDKQILNKLQYTNPDAYIAVKKMEEEYQFHISKFSHELRNPVALINSQRLPNYMLL